MDNNQILVISLGLLICEYSRGTSGITILPPLKMKMIKKSFSVNEKEWAVSPIATMKLAKEEKHLHSYAVNYMNSLKDKLHLLDRWIEDYESSTKSIINLAKPASDIDNDELIWENARKVSSHPLMTYRMMRRFVYDLKDITTHESGDVEKFFLWKFEELNYTFSLPKPLDVLNVTDSIIRLQNVYDLNATDIMNGIIANKRTNVGLSLRQAFDIGKHALTLQMYPEAFDWLQTVLNEIKIKPNNDVGIGEVIRNIRQLIQEHDDLHNEINETNYYNLNINRFHDKIVSDYPLETVKAIHVRYFRGTKSILDSFSFMLLCNGDNFQTNIEKSKLYCRYDTNSHPAWTINPLKIEVYSFDPYLIQIYDAIGKKVIQYLKTCAVPLLSRAGVALVNENGTYDYNIYDTYDTYSTDYILPIRVSSYAFLNDSEHPLLEKLEKIIGSMTGLEVETRIIETTPFRTIASEQIQIAAYTFGGHYVEHLDALQYDVNETDSGDRLGTFMIYLNDVELGGHTAFPIIGTAVVPVKGSAVFWYDLKRSGTVDDRTLHGGCPVIIGQKWVANKWIHYNANFLKRKCSLNHLE